MCAAALLVTEDVICSVALLPLWRHHTGLCWSVGWHYSWCLKCQCQPTTPGHVFPATPLCQGRLPCSWKNTWTRKSLSVGWDGICGCDLPQTYHWVLIIIRKGCGKASCPEELLMQRADKAGVSGDMSCQRVHWPRCTTHAPSLVCQGAESTWFPISFPHLLLFWGRSVPRKRQSVQLTWHAFSLRCLQELGEEGPQSGGSPSFWEKQGQGVEEGLKIAWWCFLLGSSGREREGQWWSH